MTAEFDSSVPKKRRTRGKPEARITDIQALLSAKGFRFESPEDPRERQSRLAIKEDLARHDLWRDRVLIFASLAASAVVGLTGIVLLSLPGQPPETRTWAMATLSAIVSGVVSYSFGRAAKSP